MKEPSPPIYPIVAEKQQARLKLTLQAAFLRYPYVFRSITVTFMPHSSMLGVV
jgi:hypothetical protein